MRSYKNKTIRKYKEIDDALNLLSTWKSKYLNNKYTLQPWRNSQHQSQINDV